MSAAETLWLAAMRDALASQRRTLEAAVAQLSDEELHARPAPGINSVAVILRHLGGNLLSRWTDFLTTDGEKPDRQREREFEDWTGDRESLLAHLDAGWRRFEEALDAINSENLNTPIFIRGEQHTIPLAIARSLAHLAYHVGQVMMIARSVHGGEWRWLTIPPGQSQAHNDRTWGSGASRGAAGMK